MTALKVLVCVLVLAVTTFAQEKRAIAYLEHTSNSNVHIYGYVTFVQLGDGYVTVAANIRGLPDGRYAMHVHEFGDLTNYSGSSAGPHFVGNGSVSHGCPYSSVRHAGDMGTWNSTSGLIQEEKYLDLLQLSGNFSVIGRAVVLHSTFDSCTGDSGNAGSRIAFGTIGIQNLHDSQAATDFVAPLLVAKLYGTVHCGFCSGFVFFNSNPNETTITVTAYVNGLIGNTVHGIHIHEYGDLTFGDGSYLGAHWNPTGALHGLPIDEDRHAGDLGNVQNYDGAGVAWYQYNTTLIASPSNITGRGVVVHELSDKGRGFACSTANGNSGVRYIAGVIGIASNTTVIPVVPIEIDNTWADEDCEEMPEPISTHTTVIGLPEITSDIIIYTSINSSSMLNISIFVILASLALLM